LRCFACRSISLNASSSSVIVISIL
jgi:hypothetical protein